MKTVVVELRLCSQDYTSVPQTTSDLNDVLVHLASMLDMDILSISHSHHVYGDIDIDRKPTWCYSSTCVYERNEQTLESIALFVGKRADQFATEDGKKVLINIFRL